MTPIQEEEDDEYIVTLNTPEPWSSPSYKSSPIWLRVWFRINRPSWTKMAISPSYDIETRCSLIRWKEDETFHLVLVQAPEASWIILCDHDNICVSSFGPRWLCIVLGLKPMLWAPPWSPPTLARPFCYKLSSRCLRNLGFV
jgi:hypothetical protein